MDLNSLKFADSHEWVKVESNTATVGITDFAVKELTDLVFIELPKVGTAVEAKLLFGQVESVKAASDLISPMTGTVVDVNEELPDNLEWLSEAPYTKGWMIRIELNDPSEADQLMSRDAYTEKYS